MPDPTTPRHAAQRAEPRLVELKVLCPDCGGPVGNRAQRRAVRRCKGLCKGTGYVTKHVPQAYVDDAADRVGRRLRAYQREQLPEWVADHGVLDVVMPAIRNHLDMNPDADLPAVVRFPQGWLDDFTGPPPDLALFDGRVPLTPDDVTSIQVDWPARRSSP